jgi:hypothetical protein
MASDLPGLPGADWNHVTRVAYSKGERPLLAVGFSDGTLSIWKDLCELARLHAHDKRITGLAFTPDEKHVATVAEDGVQLRFWNLGPVFNLRLKAPGHETDTVPPGLGGRPIDTREGLEADARWNEAVVSETSAKASLEKAEAKRNLDKVDLEHMKSLRQQAAVEAKLVEEAELRLSVAENSVLVAKADVALAEARKKHVEIEFEIEWLRTQIDRLKTVARQQDDPAILAALAHATKLSRIDHGLTRDAAAAELERAKAKLAQATANVAFHTRQLDRLWKLPERPALEERIVREAEGQLKDAEAEQHAAQAIVSAAEARLKAAEGSLKARNDPQGSIKRLVLSGPRGSCAAEAEAEWGDAIRESSPPARSG